MRTILASVLVLFALGGAIACGDDADETPQPSSTAAQTARPSAEPSASPAATGEEEAWMRQICMRDSEFEAAHSQIPGIADDTSQMTLDQRRARGEIIWPAIAELHEAYVEDVSAITPPASAAALHQSIVNLSEVVAQDMRRSISEIDAIFQSVQTVESNNARLNAAERASILAVDEQFNAAPQLLALYESLPECRGGESVPPTR